MFLSNALVKQIKWQYVVYWSLYVRLLILKAMESSRVGSKKKVRGQSNVKLKTYNTNNNVTKEFRSKGYGQIMYTLAFYTYYIISSSATT